MLKWAKWIAMFVIFICSILTIDALVGSKKGIKTITAAVEEFTADKKNIGNQKEVKQGAETSDYKHLDMQHYAWVMDDYLKDLSDVATRFRILEADAEIKGTINKSWVSDVGDVFYKMSYLISSVRYVEPPTELKGLHSSILKAMDNLQFVIDNYGDAASQTDLAKLDKCLKSLRIARDTIDEARSELSTYE
ncbi:hypothetical protein P4324_30470 [Bacillus thuringiensis]|nr:hypothetical protein [Bacillus thuringiensis]MED2926292.1 hypothetical protein [Bacillus thuringiensis]MED3050846.1 hypothetical protein [Bacillus thuringiensis]